MTTGRHLFSKLLKLSLITAAFCFLTNTASAQKTIFQHNYPRSGDSQISLTSPFETGPTHGFQPIRVSIKNGSSKDRQWHIQFQSSSELLYGSAFDFTVKAGQEINQDILVPVRGLRQHSRHRQQNVKIQADGFSNLSTSNYGQVPNNWPNIIISEKLAAINLNLLSNHLNEERNSKIGTGRSSFPEIAFAARSDNQLLPSDWRAYLGYDAMMIAASEWSQLRPAVQSAILEWNRFGGILQIYTELRDKQLDYLALGFDRKPVSGNIIRIPHSYGTLELHGWDGKNIKVSQTYNTLKNANQKRINFEQAYSKNWGLQKDFGSKKSNPLLVLVILTVFSIIVGPVNLFVFAKSGRRHRLFFTTPLISLIAASLVLTFILFEDGVGGQGRRILVMNLESAASEKRAYITQEQISRTGVLLGNRFQIQDSTFIAPVQLARSRWSPSITRSNPAEFSFKGNQLRGDWFQSRSEQAQLIQSVQPTRSRVELISPVTPTQNPILFSSLEFTVEELFYVGNGGRVWKAKTSPSNIIAPGSKIILEPSTRSALGKWWNQHCEVLSVGRPNNKSTDHSFRRQTRGMSFRPGHFFTTSQDPKIAFIETLDAVRWDNAKALIFGPVAERPQTQQSSPDESSAKP